MFSNFSILYYLIGVIDIWRYIIIGVSIAGIITCVLIILTILLKNNLDPKYFDEAEKKLMASSKKLCILFVSLLFILSLFPSKKSFLIYVSLKSVDNYNIENVDSNLTPNVFLEVIDNTLEKCEKFLNSTD